MLCLVYVVMLCYVYVLSIFYLCTVVSSLISSRMASSLLSWRNLNLREILENYRPITNLSFVSKLIKRVVSSHLDEHLALYDLLSPSQSAYRAGLSTETALLALQNDLLLAASRSDGCVVLLLDLSAAFDTVDHGILIDRLSSHCGLGGTALSWFASYLSGRTQSFVIDGVFSHPVDVIYGVPQGSVLTKKGRF